MTGFVVKSSNTKTLLDAVIAMSPTQGTGPILIVDDDPQVRESHKKLVEEGLPGYPIRLAENGEVALGGDGKGNPITGLARSCHAQPERRGCARPNARRRKSASGSRHYFEQQSVESG